MLQYLRRTTAILVIFIGVQMPTVGAQVIPIRTVPVASGDQFTFLPSNSLAMGGIDLAVDDSLADGWSNPARGAEISVPVLMGSPTFYGISRDGGAGKTLPIGALFTNGAWFGGVALALQQIENASGNQAMWIEPWVPWNGPARRLNDASARNLFARAFVGTSLGSGPWAIGLGFSTARLDAMDGVDLLYAGAESIDQSGSLGDIKLGLYRHTERDRLGLVMLHSRVSMTHDVTYLDFTWDTLTWIPTITPRVEVNEDRTRTWGGRIMYDRDLEAPGWRLGTSFTVNHKSHPKIPNYEIQNIPRDPGTTWAYDVGVGVSRTRGATTFGLDLHLQPIFSNTWQEADAETPKDAGGVIPEGGRTIENEFFFTNAMIHLGLDHRWKSLSVQAGMQVRSYDYDFEQRNHIDGSFRDQRESWMEWVPSVGAALRLSDMEVRYTARATSGTGQPGVQMDPAVAERFDAASDFIVAPSGPLTLQDARVLTHQFAVVIPIR
jgi:hypothetical protein